MQRSIINVPANIDKTQSILPRLHEDQGTIGVLLKRSLVYKSPFISGNVRPNMIMLALKDLLNTPLYRELNVRIHPLWSSLFAIHLQTKIENDNSEEDIANQDNFEEEIEDVFTETMVHNFLDSEII